MGALIRAATLSRETHRLASRQVDPAASASASAAGGVAPSAPVVVVPQLSVDMEAQREWQQRAEQDLLVERERARKEGHATGYTQGLAEAQALLREKHQRLDQLMTNAGQALSSQLDGLEDIAVSVAFEATMKLLGAAMVTREGVQAVVEQVLVRSHEQERLTVRLAPGDFYLLLQQNAEAPWHAPAGVELVPDDRVELGGCLVDTGSGSLDGRLETQLDTLRQLLLRTRAQRHSGGASS